MCKILYICPKLPYPAENGEDIGYDKDVNGIYESKYKNDTTLVFINRDLKNGEIPYTDLNHLILTPNKKQPSGILKSFVYMFDILFHKYPRGMTKFITKDIKQRIEDINADIVILDSIYGMAALPQNKRFKLVYVAHNCEAQLAYDIAKVQQNLFKKLYLYLQAKKIDKLEKEIISKSDVLVCVSTSDYKYFSKLYPEKIEFFAHKADKGNFSWKGNTTEKSILFCGPTCHEPNREAIEWIANSLSQVLDTNIRIKIVGKGTQELPKEWNKPNIDYLGFVSAEELQHLYQTCSAFICPIVYGSGVKIKVTEAVSYGMPVIATKESLEGLDYINIEPLIDRNDMQKTKENIESLVNDENKLKQYSQSLIQKAMSYQKESENSIEKIIYNVIQKNSKYDIISLGCDCAVRRYLTMGGLKKTKAMGELSMVFDLSHNPTKSLIKILKNDFKDYFNDLVYKKNIWVNKKYKISYNHDKDCGINDKLKITERFQKRIKNFRQVVKTSSYCYFVLKSISSAREINNVYKELESIRDGLPFKLIVLDVEQKLLRNKKFNENIAVCSVKSPFPRTDDWWKPEYIDSKESLKFQREICKFIENEIAKDFIVLKYNKEDVNQENGQY